MSPARSTTSPPSAQRILTAACLAPLALGALALPAFAVQCLQHELRAYTDQIVPVSAAEMVPTHGPGSRMGPPPDPNVGDSWVWYTWLLGGFPVAEEKVCTVRGEGTNVYIVVEDSQWLTNVDQADIDAMLEAWDSSSLGQWPDKGIYQLTEENFGPVPDQLDNDPKVYVLYYDFDVNSDGFFWAFDMFPDGTQSFASNECEVLYMNSSDFDPGGDYLISVQSHEFQHMIHWLADSNEASWINEGCSELAMWLYGLPDNINGFNSAPDNNLTEWNGNFADYVKTYLWTLYFYERFGGQATILDLVSQPGNGITGVELALDNAGYTESFADAVSDWFVANYVDDPSFGDGRYGYVGEDLPTFASVLKSTYPIPPTNASVNHWAADYVRMINLTSPQLLGFDGGDTSTWSARVIRRLGGAPVSIEPIVLDGVDAGSTLLPAMSGNYDEAILVVGNISSAGLMTYAYETDADVTGVGDSAGGPQGPGSSGLGEGSALQLALVGANPSRSGASLELQSAVGGHATISVHSADGRRVQRIFEGPVGSGVRTVVWDGRDEAGRSVAAGTYLVRACSSAGGEATARVTIVR